MKLFEAVKKHYRDSIMPEEPDAVVEMIIDIKKGESQGTALVPCVIYTLNHAIDLNPSLIRKKTKEKVRDFNVGEKIEFDSNEFDVVLSENEKKQGFKLEELESCSKCGQKIVIAEVAETRYRSCPSINVRLSQPAVEDLHVPVTFGVNKKDLQNPFPSTIILTGLLIFGNFVVFFPVLVNNFFSDVFSPFSLPVFTVDSTLSFFIPYFLLFGSIYMLSLCWYNSIKLKQWIDFIKPKLKDVEKVQVN